MRRNLSLPFSVRLALAAGAGAVAGTASAAALQRWTNPLVPQIEVAAAGTERTRLEEAVSTFGGYMAGDRLWDNFETVARGYPRIFVGPGFSADGTTDAAGAIALLRGRNAAYRAFPAQLALTGTYYPMGDQYRGTCRNAAGRTRACRETEYSQNYSNELVVTHGSGLHPRNGPELVSIELGRVVFDRYNSLSAVRRSCTFNSLAHEWTHTIGKPTRKHAPIVRDTGASAPAGVPTLSYLFGAVAQCTWLQDQRQIGAGDADLKACASRWSAIPFPSSQCV